MAKAEVHDRPPIGLKLVHLDLKGAPPRIVYLAQLFPLFSRLGANALLLEYEDMFPYEGSLEILRAKHAYSPSEIRELLDLAQSNGLEVIPLVQTFGHMEFVLKHKQFSHLREVKWSPNALNPHRPESLQLIHTMTEQVLGLHPGARWLHIGADEVYFLGEGEESQRWLSSSDRLLDSLFVSHVVKVAEQLRSFHPAVKPVMWDDMLRSMSADFLSESGIGQLVEPMVWDYLPNLDVEKTVLLIDKYQKGGLTKLWIASSFKGSTEVNQCLTCIRNHLDNHTQWLQVVKALTRGDVQLQGIALTGWQRYDHFSVLCELLPVAIPSLAACLQTLQHGSFTEEAEQTLKQSLGISAVEVDTFIREDFGSFPGCEVARLVTQVSGYLKVTGDELLEGNRFVVGWFSPYHRKHKFTHPIMVQHFEPEAKGLLLRWECVLDELRAALSQIYYPDTVEEWLQENVSPTLDRLQGLVQDLNETLQEQED